jgi:hypothetical protein
MISPYAWILLALLCILLGVYTILSTKFKLTHLLITALLVYGLFFVSQYPATLQRDVWVHGGAAHQVAEEGTVYVENAYPRQWPGSFILWAVLNEVTCINVVVLCTVLAILTMVLTVVFLYLLGQKFVGNQWAGVPGLLYLVGNAYVFQYLDRDRFSPFNMGFLMLVIFMYVFTYAWKTKTKKTYFIILLISIFLCAISNVSVAMFAVFVLAGVMLIEKIKSFDSRFLSSTLLLTVITWLSWWIFNSATTFERILSTGFSILRGTHSVRLKIVGVVQFPEQTLNAAEFLSTYYFRGMVILLIVVSVVSIVNNRGKRIFFFYSGMTFGALIFAILASLAPTFGTEVQWSRILALSLFPIAFVASSTLTKNKIEKFVAVVMIFMIIPSFLTSHSFVSLYVEAIHPWELQGFQFLSNNLAQPILLEGDKSLRVFKWYFDLNNFADFKEINWYQINFTNRLQTNPSFFTGNTIIRSFRQSLETRTFFESWEEVRNYWNNVDHNLNSNPYFRKIYDSTYMQIYFEKLFSS